MTSYEPYLIAGGVVLLGLQGLLTVHLLKGLRVLSPLGERVEHFGAALSLLTETAESGFRVVAAEVERLGGRAPGRPESRTITTRVASEARRGRSIQEIAAGEQVSEGEVRLRLHLAEQAADRGAKIAPGVSTTGEAAVQAPAAEPATNRLAGRSRKTTRTKRAAAVTIQSRRAPVPPAVSPAKPMAKASAAAPKAKADAKSPRQTSPRLPAAATLPPAARAARTKANGSVRA